MASKFFSKALSVGLSLSLCAGLVAPALAASFTDLQGVIDNKVSLKDSDNNDRIKYEEGTITLNEDVVRGEDEANKSIVIDGADGAVTIDLNGKNINGKNEASQHAVIEVIGGNLTLKDNTAHSDEETGEYISGAVTGGNHVKVVAPGHGAGVSVTEGGSLTINSGAVKENHAEESGGGVYIANGSVTMNGGLIDGNTAGHSAGGVSVNAAAAASDTVSSFTMNGGTISNNESQGGAGIYVNVYQTSPVDKKDVPADRNFAKLNGGTIKDNVAETHGGGVYVTNGALELNGTEISGNTAGGCGAGAFIAGRSEAEMTGGSVIGNKAGNAGGGLYLNNQASFTMTDGEIYNNTAGNYADDIYKSKTAAVKLPSAASMGVQGKDEDGKNITQDGKDITGWYFDGSGGNRWSKGKYPYSTQDKVAGSGTTTSSLCLKAAHDQYFDVEYIDGVDGTVFAGQKYEVENKKPIPGFAGSEPTRTGYYFMGWRLADGAEVDFETGTVTGTITLVAQWEEIPAPVTPDDPDTGDDSPEIDDQAIPLAAGPVTRAEFLDYLWRHEGEPASDGVCTFTDVPEDHEFILALAWAERTGIAKAYEDGTFEPDELVTVSAVREFLGSFASVFGGNAVAANALTSLTGEADEAVVNCDEVLAEFFGEEYVSAKEQDEKLAA